MDGFYNEADCDLDAFADLIARDTARNQVPHAAEVQKAIPIYNVPDLKDVLSDQDTRRILMAEWARILHSGAGVFILRAAQPDHEAIDRATEVFNRIIADEAGHGADHFAAAGSNDRIWNSLQKLCLADPDCHVRYFASPAIDAACEAWLGPNYQMTAQVNVVHPGGAAQQAHRDYHLGFQTAQVSATSLRMRWCLHEHKKADFIHLLLWQMGRKTTNSED